MLLLGEILRRQARVREHKTAYICGGDRLTYGIFHRRSNQLAHGMRRLGVGRGDRVAVLAGNCAEYPLIYFAALKLGAIVVPVNARFTADEVAMVLEHSESATLFAAADLLAPVAELLAAGRLRRLRHLVALDSDPRPSIPSVESLSLSELADRTDDIDADIDENDPHVMLYTSGTTGSPKGTLLSHRAYFLQATVSHLQLGFDEDDIAVSMFPMFHMGGWALPLGFWHLGGTAVILPRPDPAAILTAIESEHATYFYGVPTVYRSLLAHPEFDRYDLTSLRFIGGGTAAMTAAQVEEIRTRFGREMVILYGSTEAGPVSVLRRRDVRRKPESVGRPYLDVDLRLVDEDGREVATGEVGEITVHSPFVLLGYWRNPEETARTLRDGWVHTGDLAVFDEEGFLSITGRRKEVIRSGGESIFPVEIERVLLAHASIREAAVVSIADPHWGEAVVAAVVVESGHALTADEVVDWVKQHLASYKKPRHVCFVGSLPRTASSQQVHKPLLKEIVLERLGLGG